MRIKWLAVLLLSLLVTSVGVTPAAAASAWVRYENKNSGYCLAVPGDSTTAGAKMIVFRCTSGGQLWKAPSSDLEWNKIENPHGLCLSIPGGSTAERVQAITWTCANSTAERFWDVTGIDIYDYGMIVNYKSRLCLTVKDGSKAEGAAVIQATCLGHPEQLWKLRY